MKRENPTLTDDFTTTAIHGGRHGATSAVPIFQGINAPHENGRIRYVSALGADCGPTIVALEKLVAELEEANWSLTAPSGMAAIYLTFFSLLHRDARIVAHRCIYSYATRLLIEDLAPKWGVEVTWVDMRDLNALEKALQKPAQLVYFEPIANPAMHVLDTAAIVNLAHKAGAVVAVDNTLLSPYLLKPLELGVDLVLHSATKYLGGHGDALAGVISGRDEVLHETLSRMRSLVGGVLAPMSAYLVIRGIRTLPFRMEQHCANARAVAAFLATREEITAVRFPNPTTNPNAPELPAYGALLGFTLADQYDPEIFRSHLKMCRPWGSLGDVETLVAVPDVSDWRDVPPNYVRVAVGLEAPQDIIGDLEQAFEKLAS
ncbi:MAG: PLP-dependent aspartate aminotransferase family protein [Chloroflexota bacterium]